MEQIQQQKDLVKVDSVLQHEEGKTHKIIQVERNLETIGYFSATRGNKSRPQDKAKSQQSKIVHLPDEISDGQVLKRWYEIRPDKKLGLPDSTDLDFYRGVQAMMYDKFQKTGQWPDEIEFRPSTLLRLTERPKGKTTYSQVFDFVTKLATVGIFSHGAITDKKKKRYWSTIVNLCDAVCRVGDTHPKTGEISEVHYLKFADWYMNMLNSNFTKPLNIDFYFSLKSRIARHLYGLFDVMLYAGNGQAHKKYVDLCNVIGLIPQEKPSDIRRQLQPAIDELKQKQYLSECNVPTSIDDVLEFKAGPKFDEIRESQESKKYKILNVGTDDVYRPKLVLLPEFRKKPVRKPVVASPEASQLVAHFHKEKRNINNHTPYRSEADYAQELINKHGKDGAKAIVDKAIDLMNKAKWKNAATFGSLRTFAEKIEQEIELAKQAEKEQRERALRKQQEEQRKQKEREERRKQLETLLPEFRQWLNSSEGQRRQSDAENKLQKSLKRISENLTLPPEQFESIVQCELSKQFLDIKEGHCASDDDAKMLKDMLTEHLKVTR